MARAPFRADHVGSLLRPASVGQAKKKFAAGEISREELTAVEDQAIIDTIANEERVGLKSITDGEIRRENWSLDFFLGLDGTEVAERATAPRGHGGATPTSNVLKIPVVVGKIGFSNHPMLEHFKFLKAHTKQTAKITVPSPTMIVSASRDWRDIIDSSAYSSLDAFYEDLGAAYRDVIRGFYDVGCRYLQFDDVNMAYLCDQNMRAAMEQRGDDPEQVFDGWIKVLNSALSAKPSDMAITTHICRGNFKSAWFAQGGYEPIADKLFNQLDYDGYFLEYDSDRAGGFEPLRFLPKGKKRAVLGLMTSKTGELEDPALIKARIEETSKYADLDQFCLSPQCGFASHEDGNLLSEEEEWNKLRQIVEISQEVWPSD